MTKCVKKTHQRCWSQTGPFLSLTTNEYFLTLASGATSQRYHRVMSPTSWWCHQYHWSHLELLKILFKRVYFNWWKFNIREIRIGHRISIWPMLRLSLHWKFPKIFRFQYSVGNVDLVIGRFDVFERATFKKQFSFLISKIKDTTIIISFSQVVSRSTINASVKQTITRHHCFQVQDQFGFSIQDDLSESYWKFNQSEWRIQLVVD